MITFKNKEIFKSDRITKLIEGVKNPRSLNEIMYKFNIGYPFKVKCVVDFYETDTLLMCNVLNKIFTFYRNSICNNCADAKESNGYYKDSKKFQYIP